MLYLNCTGVTSSLDRGRSKLVIICNISVVIEGHRCYHLVHLVVSFPLSTPCTLINYYSLVLYRHNSESRRAGHSQRVIAATDNARY